MCEKSGFLGRNWVPRGQAHELSDDKRNCLQWESAILDGFRVFHELRKPEHRGGGVSIIMDEHRIDFHPLHKQHERQGFLQAIGGNKPS